MPTPRFHRLPPERQREILDVAARHFANDGLAGASVNRILADCGLSKGAAYYYFFDKNDLYATVVEESWQGLLSDLGLDLQALDAEGFWPALERLYRHQILAFSDRPWLWLVGRGVRAALADPATGPALAGRLAALSQATSGVVARGQALGVVRTDLPDALLTAMFEGLDDGIDAWLVAHPERVAGPEGDALLGACFASLRGLLATRPERAS